jgi:hypothetical protein
MRILISMMSLSLTVSVACTTPSLAAEKSYLCAIHDVYECVDVTGCNRISLETANLAAVMVLDVENKKLKSAPIGQEAKAVDIDNLTIADKFILLHGVGQNAPTPRSFSALVDTETGKLSAGVSTPDASLALTGKCTAQP